MIFSKRQTAYFVYLLIFAFTTCLVTNSTTKSVNKINTYEISQAEITSLASQKYEKDTNTVKYSTNSMTLLKDTIIKFTIDAENELSADEEFDVFSSNKNVADTLAKSNTPPFKKGSEVSVYMKDYGHTVITVQSKISKQIMASFPIYVANLNYTQYDSIYNITIESENNVLSIDPMKDPEYEDITQTIPPLKNPNYLMTNHTFIARSSYKATDFTKLKWEVSPADQAKIIHKEKPGSTADTIVTVNFGKGGKYTLFVREKADNEIVDSLNFYVNLHEDLSGNLETGMLSSIRDDRDGEIYEIDTTIYKEDAANIHRIAMMKEDLRYMPYVYPEKGNPNYLEYIGKIGNKESYSPKWVKENVIGPDSVLYNMNALFPKVFTGLTYTFTSGDAEKIKAQRESLCPKGWTIPTQFEFEAAIGGKFKLVSPRLIINSSDFGDYKFDRYNIKLPPVGGAEAYTGIRTGVLSFSIDDETKYFVSQIGTDQTRGLKMIQAKTANSRFEIGELNIYLAGSVRCVRYLGKN